MSRKKDRKEQQGTAHVSLIAKFAQAFGVEDFGTEEGARQEALKFLDGRGKITSQPEYLRSLILSMDEKDKQLARAFARRLLEVRRLTAQRKATLAELCRTMDARDCIRAMNHFLDLGITVEAIFRLQPADKPRIINGINLMEPIRLTA